MVKQTVAIEWKFFSIKHGTRDECNSVDESQPKCVRNKEARSKRGITPGIDHMLGHITNLNAFKRIERIYSVFYK